jgi:glycosyltransferase involved in cell wall biosynthesis
MSVRLAIVLTTRNRSQNLQLALESICNNSVLPETISIVSSGENINNTLTKYLKLTNIVHEHVTIAGQYHQRQVALDKVVHNHDLILLMDDYNILDNNFVYECITSFSKLENYIVGMGVTIVNHEIVQPRLKNTRRLIHNYSPEGGVVLKSGIGIPYQNLEKYSSTEWLNGSSVWRSFIFNEFKHVEMNGTYAAAEDLIFSYPISKKYKLITNRDLKLMHGERNIKTSKFFWRAFKTNLHRLFFVEQHQELSKIWFYVNLIVTTFFSLLIFLRSVSFKSLFTLLGNILSIPFLVLYELLRIFRCTSSRWLLSF